MHLQTKIRLICKSRKLQATEQVNQAVLLLNLKPKNRLRLLRLRRNSQERYADTSAEKLRISSGSCIEAEKKLPCSGKRSQASLKQLLDTAKSRRLIGSSCGRGDAQAQAAKAQTETKLLRML